jgi:hypothetical protein
MNIADDVLFEGLADDVHVGDIDRLLRNAGLADVIAARRIGMDAVSELVRGGLAVVGYGRGRSPGGVLPPSLEAERLPDLETRWMRGDDPFDVPWLSLTPTGDESARRIAKQRSGVERQLMRRLVGRHPALVAGLDPGAEEAADGLRLAYLAREAGAGVPPRFRSALSREELANVFTTLDSIYRTGDGDIKKVIAEALLTADLYGEAFESLLGPSMRERHEQFLLCVRKWGEASGEKDG